MKKTIFLIFLNLIMLSTASANNLQDKNIVIPIKLIRGYPAFEASIEGTPVQLLIDTGSSSAILLKNQTAKNFNLVKHKKFSTFASMCGNKVVEQAFTLPQLNLGNTVINNINGYIYTQPPGCTISSGPKPSNYIDDEDDSVLGNPIPHADGSVGIDFFTKTRVIFDLPRQKLTFFTQTIPQNYANLNWQWFNFKLIDKTIIINAIIQNKKLSLLLDTGGGYSMLNPELNIKPNHTICSSLALDGSNCKELSLNEFKIDSANLGKYTFAIFNNLSPTNQPMPFDGVLGTDFFKKYIVLIDFINLKIGIVTANS